MSDEIIDLGDLTPKQVIVRIKGKDYYLKEASADDVKKYRNACVAKSKPSGELMVPVEGYYDTELMLVGMCLHDGDKKVPAEFVKGLPNSASDILFNKARVITGLVTDELTVDALKNKINELQKKLADLEGSGEKDTTGKQ